MKKLVIIGIGGHGRVVEDIARLNGYEDIGFLDDNSADSSVIGKISEYVKFLNNSVFFIAIGNNAIRERFQTMIEKSGGEIVNLIHPASVVAQKVMLGKGIAIMAGAVVNTAATIGDGCIINTCSSVDHDCVIGKFVHISVGTHVAGTVEIGERTFLGAGATIINNVKICWDCTVGAGAVVVKNIEKQGIYIGVPARLK